MNHLKLMTRLILIFNSLLSKKHKKEIRFDEDVVEEITDGLDVLTELNFLLSRLKTPEWNLEYPKNRMIKLNLIFRGLSVDNSIGMECDNKIVFSIKGQTIAVILEKLKKNEQILNDVIADSITRAAYDLLEFYSKFKLKIAENK